MLSPYDLDKLFVLENCQKIRINDYIRQARNSLKKAIIEAQITADGQNITFTTSTSHLGGSRLWFECPACKSRVGIIYKNPINLQLMCRKCIGALYKKQRYPELKK